MRKNKSSNFNVLESLNRAFVRERVQSELDLLDAGTCNSLGIDKFYLEQLLIDEVCSHTHTTI